MTTTVGVREFRDHATSYLAAQDVIAIQRHGSLIGFFVPVDPRAVDSAAQGAIDRLRTEFGRPDIDAQRDEVLEACRRNGAHDVRVFGSVARGTASAGSDIDLLVSFEAGRSLLDLASLREELTTLLGRAVDVVTAAGLKPEVRERVLAEARAL